MPRKKIDHAQEHRITLGNFERDLVTDYLDDMKTTDTINSVANVIGQSGQFLGYSIGGIAIGLGIYYGSNAFQGFDAKPLRDRLTDPFRYDPNDSYQNDQTTNVEELGVTYGTITTITETIRKAMGLNWDIFDESNPTS